MKSSRRTLLLILTACLLLALVIAKRFCPERISSVSAAIRSTFITLGKTAPTLPDGKELSFNPYQQKIDLYGKVVDQKGNPVPDADITVHVLSKPVWNGPTPSGPTLKLTSDAEGKFFLLGSRGSQMGVCAEKKGFIRYSPMGGPMSENVIYSGQHDSPDKPLILTLHDPGPLEPLVHIHSRNWAFPADGTLRLIPIDVEENHKSTHQIECRFITERFLLPKEDRYRKRFNWSFEIRIPGGGFVRNENDLKKEAYYQFEAPESGYQETIRYNFPASISALDWHAGVTDSFFVKFPDGTHGRIRFNIDGMSNDIPLNMETFWNPKPGSRNLASTSK